MKIAILNGAPEPGQIDAYLKTLTPILESAGHQVNQIRLRDIPLRYCVGCWGCWVKTPGQCVSCDASLEIDRAVIQADFNLWAAPLKMGFPSELLKMALDKHLPLIHPYVVVAYNEAHHRPRYPRYPRIGLLLEKEPATDTGDLEIVRDIFNRTAINFKTRLDFMETTETPTASVAQKITTRRRKPLAIPPRMMATQGVTVKPPTRLTLFNGSPRGRRGNTPLMLAQLAEGFGGPVETYHLNRMKETPQMVQAFSQAECAILGLPLYTDSMPGVVKHYIEALEPLVGRPNNPPLGFLVQSGFPEGLHSRYVERYLEKLASRLGSPYIGTIVKGGGEGTVGMPASMTQALFTNLQTLGKGLATDGRFDPQVLKQVARPERYPGILGPVFQLVLRMPFAHAYFDNMLKKNGAYERRFARPFAE